MKNRPTKNCCSVHCCINQSINQSINLHQTQNAKRWPHVWQVIYTIPHNEWQYSSNETVHRSNITVLSFVCMYTRCFVNYSQCRYLHVYNDYCTRPVLKKNMAEMLTIRILFLLYMSARISSECKRNHRNVTDNIERYECKKVIRTAKDDLVCAIYKLLFLHGAVKLKIEKEGWSCRDKKTLVIFLCTTNRTC